MTATARDITTGMTAALCYVLKYSDTTTDQLF